MFSARDEYWMQRAIALAKQAEIQGEVPVGAVLVLKDELIAEGFNQSITKNDATAHAEIEVIRSASQRLNNYRLINTTLYVTLEPCLMCAGALVHARVKNIIYGAKDLRAELNHHVISQGGLLKEACGAILSEFFQKRRKN